MAKIGQTAGLALLASLIPWAGHHAEASFTGFGTGAGFTLNGQMNGAPTISNGVLTLTDGFGSETRSAFYNTAQSITSFTAQFTYQDVGGGGADGVAFVIQNNPQGVNAGGTGGGALGYGGLTQSVGVLLSLLNPSAGTGLGVNGTTATFTPSGAVAIPSGHLIRVNLSYDGATLSETLVDQTTLQSFSAAYRVDIAGTIGSSTGFVGFTGATGAGASTQQISALTFANAAAVPEPSSLLLLGVGAGGGWVGVRSRRARRSRTERH